MRLYKEAMEMTSKISVDLILSEEECSGFWDLMAQIPPGGTAVEIGCYRGRSSSLMLQAAQDNHFLSIHVDPWTTGEAHEWMGMAQKIPAPFVVLKMTSEQALALPWLANVPLDLVYIDGDHETPAVEIDVKWGERIKPGGILCAHDYGRDFLSGVEITLKNYVKDPKWQMLGVWGTLAAWRKVL